MHSKYNPVRMPKIGALAVAVAALMAAGSAMAAEQLYGGGATFPAPAYVGNTYTGTNPDSRLSTNAGNGPLNLPYQFVSSLSATSFFQDYTNDTTNQISYCQTGSGFGKTTLGGAISNQLCKDFGPGNTPLGFTSPAANTRPDFIGTDSPLSSNDYTSLMTGTNAARSPIVQIPTLAGAIALPHNASVNLVVDVKLTTEQVCKIYAGQVTNWTNVLQSGTGVAVGSGPIHVSYRADGSGTTFAFTSYLAAKCNNQFGIPANFFKPNQSFTAALLPATPAGIYASSGPAQGNNGVVGAVVATNNAIGYADFGEVQTQGADYAWVNNFDPRLFGEVSGVKTPISVGVGSLNRGKVLDGAVINNAPAAPVVPTATKNCMLLITPSVVIPSRYPIAAFTYMNTYHSGNGTAIHQTAIKDLLGAFYKGLPTSRPALPDGFAYMDGDLTYRNLLRNIIAGGAGGEPGCTF